MLVGDIAVLSAGYIVPVDGIFIKGYNVRCDKSSVTDKSDLIKKTPANNIFTAIENLTQSRLDNTNIEKLDPFIISGSKVQEGSGRFLITAVSINSAYSRITISLRTPQEDTPLQRKLNGLADRMPSARHDPGARIRNH